MTSKAASGFGFLCRFPCRRTVLCVWVLGLLGGLLYGCAAGPDTVALMRGVPLAAVSIVGALAAACLPFLLSAFAVSFSRFFLLIPLAFLEAFSLSACATLLEAAFGAGGWLIRTLVLLPGILTAPLLLWFWLRCLEGDRLRPWRDLALCLALAAGAVILEYRCISPFLAMVLHP